MNVVAVVVAVAGGEGRANCSAADSSGVARITITADPWAVPNRWLRLYYPDSNLCPYAFPYPYAAMCPLRRHFALWFVSLVLRNWKVRIRVWLSLWSYDFYTHDYYNSSDSLSHGYCCCCCCCFSSCNSRARALCRDYMRKDSANCWRWDIPACWGREREQTICEWMSMREWQ